jgi:uncharacterized membrane protein YgaE (UPF0421/DUF939 family)
MGLPWWFNTIVTFLTVVTGGIITMFGVNYALRLYFDWRVRMEETRNMHTKVVIDLIAKNEEKYQVLKKDLEELEEWAKKENEELARKCESIQTHSQEFRKDSLEMIKIALKIQ